MARNAVFGVIDPDFAFPTPARFRQPARQSIRKLGYRHGSQSGCPER